MDPLTWVYLALLAAGTAAQDQAVRKVDRETSKAQAENRQLRAKREKDSEALAQSSKDELLATKDRQAARAKELAAQYAEPATPPPTTQPGAAAVLDPNASAGTTRNIQTADALAANSKGYTDTLARLRANMNSYDSVMGDTRVAVANNASDINRNSKSMSDWTNFVLPARLAAASQSGRQWSTTGDILKLAAAVTGAAALSGPTSAAPTTTESGNIGASIQAAKGPTWLPQGADFGVGYGGLTPVGGGAVPFGSSFGLEGAAQTGAGIAGSGSSEALSRALWKQINGMQLSEAERRMLLASQMSKGV